MAIAEHSPEKLYDRNKGLLRMSHSQLHDFAATSEKGLPKYKADGFRPKGMEMSNTGWMQRARTRGVAMADGKAPEHWAQKAFAGNKGGLHRATGTPEGEKIPAYRVRKMAASGTPHEKKMAQAAMNINKGRYYKG